MPQTVIAIELQVLQISAKTRWTFVQVRTSGGLCGTGEATLGGRETAIAEAVGTLAPLLIGAALDAKLHDRMPPATVLPGAAARAALDQALWDLRGQLVGQPSAQLLGTQQRDQVALYANINRRTEDRSAAGFARSARDAGAAGFARIKIAPFDEVRPAASTAERTAAAGAGIERVFAVREAIGPQAELMVDCHWRFDETSAHELISVLAPARLHWLECPVAESPEDTAPLKRLRARCHAAGMRLAGNELGIGAAGFRPYLDAGAYDVMMPDVKYVGSLQQIVDLADDFRRAGCALSPHNPSGPVCHAASLQVCAALPDAPVLELQLGESAWFDRLVGHALPAPRDGASAVPAIRGFGVALMPAPPELVAGRWLWDGQHSGVAGHAA